jgi:hypothetical protein
VKRGSNQVFNLPYRCSICPPLVTRQTAPFCCNSRLVRRVDFWGLLVRDSRTRSTVSGDDPGLPVLFAAHKQSVSSNFLYHSLIVLSVGGSVWYLARKPRCTTFPHYCLLVVKWGTKPWHKTQVENLIIYSFHRHSLVPCARVCLWATDLRNPGGNYETHCIMESHSYSVFILHLLSLLYYSPILTSFPFFSLKTVNEIISVFFRWRTFVHRAAIYVCTP